MIKKPLILVSSGKNAQDNYIEALRFAGADYEYAFLSPQDVSRFDGLLLCGGGDIDPQRYGEENSASVNIDTERDEAEFILASSFIKAEKPIFGICRGHQLLNVALGGTLIQDLPNAKLHSGTPNPIHPVMTSEGSVLSQIYGEQFISNSSHHQAIGRIAEGLRATSWSEGGDVIEGCEHDSLPIISVQFHPERMTKEKTSADVADGLLLFSKFVELCKK